MYKQFADGLDLILQANAELKSQIEVDAMATLYEFALVHVRPGRRIGKTTYIRRNYMNGDLVIVPTHQNYLREWTRSEKVMTPKRLAISIRGHDVKTCWVDDASIVFRLIDPMDLCALLVPTGCTRIVALG